MTPDAAGTQTAARLPLGFGCSNLLGDKTRAQGRALLAAAYEAGVRHFDVARYYGYGDAEGVVGEFLRTVPRASVTVTTKFGLQPMRAAAQMRGAVAAVRRVMRSSAFLRRLVSRNAHRLVHRGQFDPADAVASLDTSLRELGVDRVDVLLLHEPTAADCTPALLDVLTAARDGGRIGAFGIGAGFDRTPAILAAAPAFTHVVQTDGTVLDDHATAVRAAPPPPGAAGRAVFTHGSIAALPPLLERFRRDAALRSAARDLLDADPADPSTLAGALLACAARANPGGLVLFRSTSPARIADNVRSVTGRFPPESLDRFAALGRGAVPPAG